MESFTEVFNSVKLFCQNELSDTAYSIWIKPLEPVKFEENTAFLFVKSEFQKKIVEDKYSDLLLKGFSEVLGFDISIDIYTEDSIKSSIGLDMNAANNMTAGQQNSTGTAGKNQNDGNYDYTFETFIVGSSNTFAYAASKAVAENKSDAYNPLFIYGPSGLGKTHLLMAIFNEIKNKDKDAKIIYVSGETFTNELIVAISKQTTHSFHQKYRNADILLMDDIQFIAGKESTQEEFFYTFNELHQLGKQIVLTSDRPPKDIKTLEERLRTRFEWGLIADISPPDFETRIAIIKRKAQLLDMEIPDEVAEYIANSLKNNIRQLEGAVKKIKAYKLLAGSPPSIAVAQTVISEILNDDQPTPVTVERIINEVGKTFDVIPEDIRSPKRSSNISSARQTAMYVVREITQMPLAAIGEEFGGRDHATVVYNLKTVEKKRKSNSHYNGIIEDIINNIRDH